MVAHKEEVESLVLAIEEEGIPWFYDIMKLLELWYIWLEGWKNWRIENREWMEKWEHRKDFISLICVWLGVWKSGRIENFFLWLRRKVRE